MALSTHYNPIWYPRAQRDDRAQTDWLGRSYIGRPPLHIEPDGYGAPRDPGVQDGLSGPRPFRMKLWTYRDSMAYAIERCTPRWRGRD